MDVRGVHPTTAHRCTLGTPKIRDFSNRFENSKNFPDCRKYSKYCESRVLVTWYCRLTGFQGFNSRPSILKPFFNTKIAVIRPRSCRVAKVHAIFKASIDAKIAVRDSGGCNLQGSERSLLRTPSSGSYPGESIG